MGIVKKGTDIPKAKHKPTKFDLVWAAGFLEGEGCFSPSNRKWQTYLRVTAGQVNKEPLQRIADMFGGRLYLRKRQKAHHNDCWLWHIDGARARGVGMTLYPFLSKLKQGQVRRGLRYVN